MSYSTRIARSASYATSYSFLVLAVGFALLSSAPTASAAPPSLRSESDMNEVVDSFMRDVTSGQIAAAYRGLERYASGALPGATDRIARTNARRRELRRSIGLSIGFDAVGVEYAAERVARITRLERFDEGALVWRFVFYRADSAWQLTEFSFSEDVGVLFGEPWSDGLAAEEPQEPEALEDAPAEDDVEPTADDAPGEEASDTYDIDIDGRRSNDAS